MAHLTYNLSDIYVNISDKGMVYGISDRFACRIYSRASNKYFKEYLLAMTVM